MSIMCKMQTGCFKFSHSRNDSYCVGRDVKPYWLTRCEF